MCYDSMKRWKYKSLISESLVVSTYDSHFPRTTPVLPYLVVTPSSFFVPNLLVGALKNRIAQYTSGVLARQCGIRGGTVRKL